MLVDQISVGDSVINDTDWLCRFGPSLFFWRMSKRALCLTVLQKSTKVCTSTTGELFLHFYRPVRFGCTRTSRIKGPERTSGRVNLGGLGGEEE